MLRNNPLLKSLSVLALAFGNPAFCQSTATPNVKQDAKNSSCSNIVALAGNVKIDCKSLTPAQQKLIESIPSLLNKILVRQLDPDAVRTMLENIQSQVNTTGVLEPDTIPYPVGFFPTPDNSGLNVFFGSNLISFNGDRCVILNLSGEDALWVERAGTGMLISAKVFDPDKKIMAEIEKNKVTINPNNTFKHEIKKHSLVVVSQADQEVLNVNFMNPHVMIITGIFYGEGFGRLVASNKSMEDEKGFVHMSGSSVGCGKGRPVFSFGPSGYRIELVPNGAPPN